MKDHPRCGHVTQATMQGFQWPFTYSAIFMVWCAAYLGRSDLVTFLRRAKSRLAVDGDRVTRNTAPKSFIFLLDNLLEADEVPKVRKG